MISQAALTFTYHLEGKGKFIIKKSIAWMYIIHMRDRISGKDREGI